MKKRVLIFIPKFPILTETFIEREVSKLVELGNLDITVLSLQEGEGSLSPNLEGKVVYKRLSWGVVVKTFGLIFSNLPKVISVFFKIGFKRPYSFAKGLGYAQMFKAHNPDVIYAHFLSEPSTIAMVASMVLGKPLAIAAHARDILEYPDLPKEKAKYAKFIAICNKNACEKAKELSGIENPENIKLIYHGLDSARVAVDHDVQKEDNLIVTVARLEEKKGLSYLIEASKLLKSKNLIHKIEILGKGPLKDELQDKIDRLGLKDTVELVGAVPFEEVKERLHKAYMFVLPSINAEGGDADGIPNTLIEAALVRLPIVTTDAGSITDFLGTRTATMVSQKDTKGLAEGIERVLTRPDDIDAMVESAFLKAKEMFDADINVKQVEELLLK